MKNGSWVYLAFALLIIAFVGCNKPDDQAHDEIVYQAVNKEFVLIRDVHTLTRSSDEVSNHVDSILSGLIQAEFISTGQKAFDLFADGIDDIGFEIIDLNEFNPNRLPVSFDTLAARVIPLTLQILDNSTFGYPDALVDDHLINASGNWTGKHGVLGTFMNAGQFQGQGERFLGIRFPKDSQYQYGWLRVYCSQHNDTLRIVDFAYNRNEDRPIKAGQKE